MLFIFQQVDYFWTTANKPKAMLFGVFLGVVTGIIPDLMFGEPAFWFGLLLYFPFHFRLTIQMFLVVFSRYEREKILGPGYGFIGAFFSYLLTTKYSLFCISWFYTIMIYVSIVHWDSL